MLRKLICTIALLVGSTFAAQASPLINVTPSLSSLTIGSFGMLNINIEGVTDLFGWQLDVHFSPTGIVNATGQADGGFLSPGQTFGAGTIDNGAGTITAMFSALSGALGVSGNGTLANITFEAIQIGTAVVSVSDVILLDSNLDQIFFNIADATAARIEVATEVATVPEPSGLALVGLGLALALAARSRRRAGQRQFESVHRTALATLRSRLRGQAPRRDLT